MSALVRRFRRQLVQPWLFFLAAVNPDCWSPDQRTNSPRMFVNKTGPEERKMSKLNGLIALAAVGLAVGSTPSYARNPIPQTNVNPRVPVPITRPNFQGAVVGQSRLNGVVASEIKNGSIDLCRRHCW
jgi:hypothetical protein